MVRVRAENQQIAAQNGLDIAPGAYLRISITDQGVGIPQENLAKIFDPYFTTKRMASQRGTGFGLAICYSIMRKHDGTITVESENGKWGHFSHLSARLPVMSSGGWSDPRISR